MNRHQFLEEFLNALGPLSEEERRQIADYYEELICDGLEEGLSEEEVLARFGSPAEAAERFRAENPAAAQDCALAPFTPSGEVRVLDLSAKDVPLRLSSVPDGPLRITFRFDPEKARVQSWQEGDVWFFRHTPLRKRLRDFFGLGGPREEITVLVPESFAGRLRLHTENAKITGESLPALEELTAGTSNTALRLERFGAVSCSLKTSNASVRIAGFSGNDLQVKTTNGTVEANAVQCGTQLWESRNGPVRLTGLQAASLSAATSNSRVTAADCRAAELSLATSNGSIVLDRVQGDQLRFATSNAAITGTVLGRMEDYRLEGCTSNAPSNLPTLAGADRAKLLTAATSNGRIQIDFI